MEKSIRYIHWHAGEALARAFRLEALGYSVDSSLPTGPGLLKSLGETQPAAVVIDLARLPSQGRDLGLALRKRAASRRLPLVFLGGDPKKVAKVRELLPDAVFTSWEGLGEALARAIHHPPADPVVPASVFAAYAGKPLVEKLGIKPHMQMSLHNAPPDFHRTLGRLPEGAVVKDGFDPCRPLHLWFVRSLDELVQGVGRLAQDLQQGAVWIAWPKKGGALATDLTQQGVRSAGLEAGLVDYKICAIDDTWSALLFTRKAPRPRIVS